MFNIMNTIRIVRQTEQSGVMERTTWHRKAVPAPRRASSRLAPRRTSSRWSRCRCAASAPAPALSLTELAKRAGIAKSTLSQLENGTGNPSLETLWALGTALGVPLSRLIDPPRRTSR